MNNFFKITAAVALVLTIATCSFETHAQAFDADYDLKIFAGYLNKGGKSGVQLGIEYGRSRFFSLGCFLQSIFNVKDEDGEKTEFMENANMEIRCNFHWTDILHLPSNFDIYTGVNTSIRSVGLQGGVRYNFSERFGLYVEAQQPLFKVLSIEDFDNRYYNKKFGFSAGFTINL